MIVQFRQTSNGQVRWSINIGSGDTEEKLLGPPRKGLGRAKRNFVSFAKKLGLTYYDFDDVYMDGSGYLVKQLELPLSV